MLCNDVFSPYLPWPRAQARTSESVDVNLVTSQSVGQAIGSVKISETAKGLNLRQT